MKAVTIAKIARIIVIISVLLVLAIPTFAGIESFKITNGEFVGTDSVYEVNCMTADDLSSNIKDVTEDRAGYTISYGTIIKRSVPTNDTDRKTMAEEIKAAIPNGKATLMDPEGNICRQQTIMGSSEKDFKQYIFTGVRLSGSMVNMVKLSGSLESVINGVKNTISPIGINPNDDSYDLKIEIPYLLFAAALAAGDEAKIGLSIGIEYSSFFSMKFSLDLPVKDFTGGMDIKLPVKKENTMYSGNDPSLIGTPVKQEIDIDASQFSGIDGFSDITASVGNFGSADGGLRIEVSDDGKIKVMADKENLIDAFMSARNEDGSIDINISGEDPIHIEKDQLDSLLSMADELIKMAQEAGF